MHCPFCDASDTRVIDSRLMRESNQTRRRRECVSCAERFTTYEVVAVVLPLIIKRDSSRVSFSEDKLRSGIMRALEKRPVSTHQIEAAIAHIMRRATQHGERELASKLVGEWVMEELRLLDQVAYVRFASVYRSFEDINEFKKEISKLKRHAKTK